MIENKGVNCRVNRKATVYPGVCGQLQRRPTSESEPYKRFAGYCWTCIDGLPPRREGSGAIL